MAAARTGVDSVTTPNSESAVANSANVRSAGGRPTTTPMTGSLIDHSPIIIVRSFNLSGRLEGAAQAWAIMTIVLETAI
ncbi:hypothetical protein PFL02_03390 [Pseudomonas fluorescens]|nr:hypothetical protein PFL02_03390 [Pseudomonas fluorescens]